MLKNCLTDPLPVDQMYRRVNNANAPEPIWHCIRGTSTLECYHRLIRRLVKGSNGSARLTDSLLLMFNLRHNLRMAASNKGEWLPPHLNLEYFLRINQLYEEMFQSKPFPGLKVSLVETKERFGACMTEEEAMGSLNLQFDTSKGTQISYFIIVELTVNKGDAIIDVVEDNAPEELLIDDDDNEEEDDKDNLLHEEQIEIGEEDEEGDDEEFLGWDLAKTWLEEDVVPIDLNVRKALNPTSSSNIMIEILDEAVLKEAQRILNAGVDPNLRTKSDKENLQALRQSVIPVGAVKGPLEKTIATNIVENLGTSKEAIKDGTKLFNSIAAASHSTGKGKEKLNGKTIHMMAKFADKLTKTKAAKELLQNTPKQPFQTIQPQRPQQFAMPYVSMYEPYGQPLYYGAPFPVVRIAAFSLC